MRYICDTLEEYDEMIAAGFASGDLYCQENAYMLILTPDDVREARDNENLSDDICMRLLEALGESLRQDIQAGLKYADLQYYTGLDI